jgi:hypothetical protein
MMAGGPQHGSGEVLRLRNLAMVENIRRAEDPAWCDRLERRQVVARLGRLFGGSDNPIEAMHDHARALKEELRAAPPWHRERGDAEEEPKTPTLLRR